MTFLVDGTVSVRRRPGILTRPVPRGLLVHDGHEVVALAGLKAELLSSVSDEVPVDVLVDLVAAGEQEPDTSLTDDVVAAPARLHTCNAIEVMHR